MIDSQKLQQELVRIEQELATVDEEITGPAEQAEIPTGPDEWNPDGSIVIKQPILVKPQVHPVQLQSE